MAFPATPLDVKVELAIGANLSADPATWSLTDYTASIREQQKVVITAGRRSRVGQVVATKVSATADNTNGSLCRHNPLGANFGVLKKNTPMKISVNNGGGYKTRATVFVPGFPPSWDPSEVDQTVTLQGVGIMDRLGRSKNLRSAIFRSMAGISTADYVPHAYWPMEDGSNATQFASALPGGTPMTFSTGVSAGLVDTLPGSLPLPEIGEGVHLVGDVPSYVDAGQWVVQSVVFAPAGLTGDVVTVGRYQMTDGSSVTVGMGASDLLIATVRDSTDTVTDSFSQSYDPTRVNGSWMSMVAASQADMSGTDDGIHVSLYDLTGGLIASISELVTATSHQPIDVIFPGGLESGQPAGTSYGHYGVYIDAAWSIGVDDVFNARAAGGWVGEQAHDRIERLCREENVRVTVTGTTSAAMGAQTTANLMTQLRECGATDMGVLAEGLNWDLTYLCRAGRYNATAAITLQYDQGHIRSPWDPTDDDQDYYNDVTARRPGGSSYRVANEDEVAAVGQYETAVAVNTYLDTQLQGAANWLLHLGTNDELTWPAVSPNLSGAAASLLNSWLLTTVGEHMWITGHPLPLAPQTIKQVIEGYTEVLGSYVYDVTCVLSPASPYDVGVYGVDPGGVVSRYGAATTVLAEDLTAVETAADVTATGETWATTASHASAFPFNVNIGGLTYSCTGITGTSPSYTLTLVRLATDKTHSTGAAVTVTDTGRYAL